ncbi:MAG: TIGR04283 family arsenosugar biosynthesis glycosyltransferase [Rhodothermales bacterium]
MTVSIIIPALNEEAELPATLASAVAQPGPKEIIVVDGGSDDATKAIAERHGAQVVSAAARGRARQMNAGAAHAEGDVLLFLHADTRLPVGGLDRIRAALAAPETVAGCFRLRFDRGGFWLWLWTRSVWMRWPRWAFGDRAIFARRSAFEAAGGFPDQPVFEDLDFVQAVLPHGRFVFLDAVVVTSARRYAHRGALRQQLRNWALWSAWLLGASPHRMARFYPTHTRQPEDTAVAQS